MYKNYSFFSFLHLQVRDGDTEESPLVSRLCGYNTPTESIISTYNKLWVKFETDGSVQTRGFKAVYEAIEIGKTYAFFFVKK